MKSIKRKLLLGFSMIIILVIILGVMGLYEMNAVNNNVKSMYYDQLLGVNYIKEAQYYIALVQRAEKNIILAPVLEEKKEHIMHLEEMYSKGIIENLDKFKEITDHSEEKDKISDLIEKINELKNLQAKVVDYSIDGKQEKAISLTNNTIKISEEIEKTVGEIVNHKLEEAQHHYENSMEKYYRSFKMVITAVVLAFLISIILSIMISSSIVKPLYKAVSFAKDMSEGKLDDKIKVNTNDEIGLLVQVLNKMGEKLKSIVSNIKGTSNRVETSSQHLATSLDDTNKIMNEIGQSITSIADNSQDVLSSVENISMHIKEIAISAGEISDFSHSAMNNSKLLKDSANKGKESVDKVVSTILDVESSTKEVKVSINELGVLSKKISEITEMISNIANQTNMLALNANIEAARAGENGRGFSVVAEEVRNLAEESDEAAKTIEKMVLEVQEKTHIVANNMLLTEKKVVEGTLVAKDTSECINNVIGSVDGVVEKMQEIAKQSFKQANATDTIAKSIGKVVDISQSVAASTQNINANIQEQIAVSEEIGATSEQLYSMTEELNKMIEFFKV